MTTKVINDDSLKNNLYEVIKKYPNLSNQTITFKYSDCEITLTVKPIRQKTIEKLNNTQISEDNENSFGSISEEAQDAKQILNIEYEKESKSKQIDNQKYIPNEENNNKKPKGLLNLGLSCYMNSLLQCLYHIKELREYFIKNKDNYNQEQKVCKEFAKVMYGLKNDEKDYLEPREFKNLIGEKNSLFSGRKGADVKDLFFTLIDNFLNELSNDDDNDNKSIYSIISFSFPQNVFEQNLKEVDQENIINKLFLGYYETKYNCSRRKTNIYSFQNESFILFELGKIEKYFGNDKLSIESCFKYYYRDQKDTFFYCNICRKTHNGMANEKIYRPPKILVVILDRGKGKTFKGEIKIKKSYRRKKI